MGHLQPRLKSDISRVITASAKNNNRSVPQEVDQLLREHFFSERIILGRWHPGMKPDENRAQTPAEELGFVVTNGVLHGPDPHPFRVDYPKTNGAAKLVRHKARKK